ncbi:cupin domain-containing protein [Rhodoplanes sp. TEM]|uniref:Cupin domain-containing protein n=1 Tax=Rhodoplanes tepidamans TaxID=200616 RepID=A0ABT5J5U1_RHOTP|nr:MULTISPECIES: cupin domain-containing protein [Rhodoplanes]MDC7785027.1 cupin domain-containing protein [Rhodoplanes tepidamans]MDC7982501.1 cupin domain-containing protein [Rhodoplanes sp. TEM]MDQ0356515.1 putative cupin superfamily protein [Rhodoplanes tepidamans]
MHVTRFTDAKPYEAKRHHAMVALQLQGGAESATEAFTCGLSHFLPGGGAEMSASAAEKLYVVVAGEVTVITDGGEVVLGPLDSCHLAPGEARAIENRGNAVASMLVILSKPKS